MSTRSAIEASEFLQVRIVSLAARSRRLARIDYNSVGIRPQDLPYAPSPEHFRAANQRLAAIDAEVARRLAMLRQNAAKADPQRVLIDAVREGAPGLLDRKALPPISYMEHGYSPATRRRGTVLARLLGETNPFPMIRIPWDRDNPWQTVFMHECAHNLHADMRIWQENRSAVAKRVRTATGDPLLTGIYSRWHKEIFADIAALLLAGPAAGWGMALFLTHPAPRALTYRHGGVHPTGFLRGLMLAEMMRRMGFAADGERLGRVWRTLYDTRRFHRMPERLLGSARRLVPIVVDEIAYQTRRNLAHRALADIIRFSAEDEQAIQTASRQLIAGAVPNVALPPRHLVSAASYALASGRVKPSDLSQRVVHRLASEHPPAPATLGAAEAALAA